MKSKKKVFKIISITEYKSLEIYLERMAAKGYMLSKIKKSMLIFNKTEPMELSFNVSLFYHTTPFDYPDREKETDYRELCEECGWTFCTKTDIYQIFYKNKESETIPIHTDNHEEYRIIKSTFMKTEFILLPCILMFALMSIYNIRHFDYEDLLSNSALFSLIWPLMITLLFIVALAPSINWLIRNKINLKTGKELTFYTERQIRVKNILHWSLFGLYSIFFLFSFIDLMGMTLKSTLFILLFIPIFLPIIITLFCMKKFKSKKRTRKQNIVFFSVAIILTFIISTSSVFMLIASLLPYDNRSVKNDDAPTSIPVLELSDFGAVDSPLTTRLRKQSSVFSPVNIEYYERLGRKAKDNEMSSVRTTYIECLNERIANYIFKGYMEKERESIIGFFSYTDNVREEDYISEISKEIWNVDKGYLLGNGTHLALLKGRIIYILDSNVDFSQSDIIAICKEKLELSINDE